MWPRERQDMPWDGFSRSQGYRGIGKWWGKGQAVRFRAVRQGVQMKKGHLPRVGWGTEALRVDRHRCFICRPETASYAGVSWEQVDRLRRPHTTDGVAYQHSDLLSLRRNGARTQGSEGDKCRYLAVFLRS